MTEYRLSIGFPVAAIAVCLVSFSTAAAEDFVGGNFQLRAFLDEPEGYCMDIFGYGTRANIGEPLSVHTCKPEGWRDATFTVDYPDKGQIYAPAYDRCAELTQVERGGHLFLKPCSESPLQRFFYRDDQKIEVQSGPGPRYCMVVHPGDGIATGGPSHVRREVLLLACDTLEPQFAQWRLPDGATGLGSAPQVVATRPDQGRDGSRPAGRGPFSTPEGAAAFYATACGPCHGASGEGLVELHAPKLSGQEDWYLSRQLRNFVDSKRGANASERWASQMRYHVSNMGNDALVASVSAYIAALPDEPAAVTVEGDAVRGAELYEQGCTVCHGVDGMGIEVLNAPRQVGMTDWYLVSQLEKYRTGVRGDNPDDIFAALMVAPAKALPDDQAVLDVVAYINTLRTPF
jgi:cytochrome c oxidase subunit 2